MICEESFFLFLLVSIKDILNLSLLELVCILIVITCLIDCLSKLLINSK